MNTQMERQSRDGVPADNSTHQSEHQSVLKKVKAKAKKIKNSITKHGHSHDDTHPHPHDKDEDEDEMEADPEFHGAPMYESKDVRSYLPGQHEGDAHVVTRQGEECRSFIPEQVGVSKEGGVTFGGGQTQAKTNLPILGKQPLLGVDHPSGGVFDRPTSLEADPGAPGGDKQPENYESKVKDPTGRGGQEIGATPILHSLDKMSVYNDQGVVHQMSGTQAKDDVATSEQTSSLTDYGKKVASTVYDKGVSAKEYIAEKVSLSPKEEDKALAEVISGALHVSDDKDKEEKKEKNSGGGKVTFSKKVVRQLGEEEEKDIGSGGSGPGETVVDMLNDTVTSWLGVGGSGQPSTLVYHDIPKPHHNQGDHNRHNTPDGNPRYE